MTDAFGVTVQKRKELNRIHIPTLKEVWNPQFVTIVPIGNYSSLLGLATSIIHLYKRCEQDDSRTEVDHAVLVGTTQSLCC